MKLVNSISVRSNTMDFRNELLDWYKASKMDYPKFYKMNGLCQLGSLAVHALVADHLEELAMTSPDRVATIFFNYTSSLDADFEHQGLISSQVGLPSPAIFVYTLPNILNGELSIRYGWSGFSAFYLKKDIVSDQIEQSAKHLFSRQGADWLITGKIDIFEPWKIYEADLFLYRDESNF